MKQTCVNLAQKPQSMMREALMGAERKNQAMLPAIILLGFYLCCKH